MPCRLVRVLGSLRIVRKSSGREAARLRAGLLLRSRWRSVVALGVIAGLGGGVVIGLVSIARDTSSAIDRYVEHLGEPDVAVTICPPGTDAAAAEDGACFVHDPVREVAALRRLPGVRAAARVSPTPVAVRAPGGEWRPSFAWVVHDDVELFEHPPLVAGRAAELGRPDEIDGQRGHGRAPRSRPGRPPGGGAVVGRRDLRRLGVAGPAAPGHGHGGGGRRARRRRPGRTPDPGQPGHDRGGHVPRAGLGGGHGLQRLLPLPDRHRPLARRRRRRRGTRRSRPRPGSSTSSRGVSPRTTPPARSETVDYQARAALATAALLALAGMVLVGQILGRQARRELADADTLRALGMTRRGLTSSAVPRWIATGAVAGAIAVVTAVLIRPLGPVGIARRAAGCRAGGEPGRGRCGRARRRGLRCRDGVARDLSGDGGPQGRTNAVVRLHSTVAPVGRGFGRHGAHRERRPGASLVGRPGGPGQRSRHRRGDRGADASLQPRPPDRGPGPLRRRLGRRRHGRHGQGQRAVDGGRAARCRRHGGRSDVMGNVERSDRRSPALPLRLRARARASVRDRPDHHGRTGTGRHGRGRSRRPVAGRRRCSDRRHGDGVPPRGGVPDAGGRDGRGQRQLRGRPRAGRCRDRRMAPGRGSGRVRVRLHDPVRRRSSGRRSGRAPAAVPRPRRARPCHRTTSSTCAGWSHGRPCSPG